MAVSRSDNLHKMIELALLAMLAVCEASLTGWPGWSGPLSGTVTGQEADYTIQLASVTSPDDAWRLVDRLEAAGLGAYVVKVSLPGIGVRYRIRYGRYRTAIEARNDAEKVLKSGIIENVVVMREEGRREPRVSGSGARGESVAPKSPPIATSPVIDRAVSGRVISPPRFEVTGPGWEDLSDGSLPARRWNRLRFIDHLTGWIAGDDGALWRTTDGGRSWWPAPIRTRARLIDISFIDWNSGWVLGEAEPSGREPGRVALLFSTRDGGRTWSRREVAAARRIFFTGPSDGWLTGPGSMLLRTLDGGTSWRPVRAADEPGDQWNFEEITFSNDREGWLTANREENGDLRGPALFRTTDAAASWRRTTLPRELGERRGRIERLRFFSPTSGLITGSLLDGERRRAFRLTTEDGGRTWSLAVLPGSLIAFAERHGTPDHAWLLVSGAHPERSRLLSTSNGGSDWREEMVIDSAPEKSPGVLIFIISPNRGWVIGGNVVKTRS